MFCLQSIFCERSCPKRPSAVVGVQFAPRFHAVQFRHAPDDHCRFRHLAPGQQAVQFSAGFRALHLVRVHEHGTVQNRHDGPVFVSDAVITSASMPCVPDTAGLTFHDQVCQLSSPPTNVSMLSKPRAFSCGRSLADCYVGGAPCGCCCCCHCCCCCCSCCCITCMNWSSLTVISMLRVTKLRYNVK